jgi:hypothetical protein
MSRFRPIRNISAGAALAALAWTTAAGAQPGASTQSTDTSVQPIVGERVTYQPPNRPLVIGGLITFGVAYGASVIVAAEANTKFDNYLYIPIAGPWIDIGNRPDCGGVLQPRCSTEWGRKAILVANGILQAAGAGATILGFVLPGKRTEIVTAKSSRADKARVHLAPSQVGADAYGVAAFGDF